MIVTTMNDIPGYAVDEVYGEVMGLTVRSRNIGSQIGAGLKSILGGELKGMTKALIDSRQQVMERMVEEAESNRRLHRRGQRRHAAGWLVLDPAPAQKSRDARGDRPGSGPAGPAPSGRAEGADPAGAGRFRPGYGRQPVANHLWRRLGFCHLPQRLFSGGEAGAAGGQHRSHYHR